MNAGADDRKLVVALIAQNENEALKTASIGLGWAIERQYRHCYVDLYHPQGLQDLKAIFRDHQIAYVYGLAGTGSRLTLNNGMNLWTAAKIPFAALWFDHPCYNYRQHIVDSPYVFHCYHVRDHIEARQKHLPPSASRSILLPLPYEINRQPLFKPFVGRNRRIFFAKTALSPEKWTENWARYPSQLQKVLWTLSEQAQKDRNLDLADATKVLFGQYGVDASNLDLFMDSIQEVDAYIRGWRSDKLARALLPHPADIIGRGWEYLADTPRRAEILPPISAAAHWEQMNDYRIVANSSPLWRDSIHERTWGGMIAGSIVLTDRTEKSDSVFAGLPNYVGFDWQDDLQDVIADALRRAERDDGNYIENANVLLAQRMPSNMETYAARLAMAAEEVRKNN